MKLVNVNEYLRKINQVSLATVNGQQPEVRLISLVFFEDKWWAVTVTSRPKVKQIKENNRFAFCAPISEKDQVGSIRAMGKIEIEEDLEIKKRISDTIPFFKEYWKGYDDPEFTLMQFKIEKIIAQNPLDNQFHTFDLV